jgi:uroporphyrinogen decarboxylase
VFSGSVQVILFSDILTPLTGMNIPFDILKGKGPIIHNPISTNADVAQVRELVPSEAVPYVGEALTALRAEVGNAAAVLGFVGAPFTLASYIVEGGSSKHFTKIKQLAFGSPAVGSSCPSSLGLPFSHTNRANVV